MQWKRTLTKRLFDFTTIVSKNAPRRSNSQVYCDKLRINYLEIFQTGFFFCKEANCHGLKESHKYVLFLPSKTCQHHLEARMANV